MTTAPKRGSADPIEGQVPRRTPLGAVILDRPATYADLYNLPRTWRGEIIHGTLYAFPRPRARHQSSGGSLFRDLSNPFDRGRGGPGGWRIIIEPGIEVIKGEEFSPDVAGWRRSRLPHLPKKGPITIAPDWLCEVLSPSTRSYDSVVKRRFYAEIGVSYLWFIDPEHKLLMASRLEGDRWVELGAWRDDEKARVEPFDTMELDLAALWEGFGDEEAQTKEREEPSPSPPSAVV